MKILISSHNFAPSVGGIETVSELLAAEFARSGHSVKIVTQTPSADAPEWCDEVLPQPSLQTLARAVNWADLYWQNNLSLRTLWPALAFSKPVVITHQGSYCRPPSGLDLPQRLKHLIVTHTTSVAISQAVASSFATTSAIIPNPYDARIFFPSATNDKRTGDLIFLGRLVTEKGVDLLLAALALLRDRGWFPRLTIVGDGPERDALQELAGKLNLSAQVLFVGLKRHSELADLLRTHKILVVPSRYNEPFGVVALEGIACGCIVAGSEGGGLPEAIGPCGRTFAKGDPVALADVLERFLSFPDERASLLESASTHLAKFHPVTIAEAYLAVFRSKLA